MLLASVHCHTLHVSTFISKTLAETHGRKCSFSLLSPDKQAKCYPVSISIETRGDWTELNSLPIFDLASRKARLFFQLFFFSFFSFCPQGVKLTPKKLFSMERENATWNHQGVNAATIRLLWASCWSQKTESVVLRSRAFGPFSPVWILT